MTDERKSLADRLIALDAAIEWLDDQVSGGTMPLKSREHLALILAVLRQPSTDDAFRRGAEAMREADVTRCLSTALTFRQMGIENTARAFESQAEMIRLAPLPEPKP